MTKTLTEQWRDGTLKGGIYYLLLRDGTTVTDETVYIVGEKQLRWRYSSFDFVKEVVAPVPSYDEFIVLSDFKKIEKDAIDNLVKIHTEKLEKKLEIATNALKRYEDKQNLDIRGVAFMKYNKGFIIARKALKEMEGVK